MGSVIDLVCEEINLFKGVELKYFITMVAAAMAVLLKWIFFYKAVSVTSNFLLVLLISCGLTWFFFGSFKNKWIPFGIYSLLAILMFVDVTYCSFFNRYLSVQMLGAAEVVGDIGASIKSIVRPSFFLVFLDLPFVFALISLGKKFSLQLFPLVVNLEIITHMESQVKARVKMGGKILLHRFLALALVFLIVINPTGFSLGKSISNQEFFSFHIGDVGRGAASFLGMDGSGDALSAFVPTYMEGNDDPLFGVAKGKNLVVIQLESFQNFVVGLKYNGKELTPNLNRLLEGNTIYFDHFYQQIGSGNTSDAEFAINNSIYGSISSYTYKLFGNNYFRGLPVLLGEQGYDSAVFHGFENREFWSRETAYPNQGFNRFYGGIKSETEDGDFVVNEKLGWGIADTDFFKQTSDYMLDLKEPFYAFTISLSNHHPYKVPRSYEVIKLKPEDRGTTVGNYLNSVAYTDHALGLFFNQLKKNGLYDNCVFAIYGDHVGLTFTEDNAERVSAIIEQPYDFQHMMSIPLIISIPKPYKDVEIKRTISIAGGQLDFMPTIAYLLGLEDLDTIYFGQNLLTAEKGFVAEQTYMPKGSFFADGYAYEMSRDGVFENGRAWNTETGALIDVRSCKDGYMRSKALIEATEFILKSDALRQLYLEGGSLKAIGKIKARLPYQDLYYVAGYPYADLIGRNSIEALDVSSAYGTRTINTMIIWAEMKADGEPIFLSTGADNHGEVSMTWKEVLVWLEKHGSATLMVKSRSDIEKFMDFMEEKNPILKGRFIPWVSNPRLAPDNVDMMLDLTEFYQGVKEDSHTAIRRIIWENINEVESSDLSLRDAFSEKEIQKLLDKNQNIWAVSIEREQLDSKFGGYLDLRVPVYVMDNDGRLVRQDH